MEHKTAQAELVLKARGHTYKAEEEHDDLRTALDRVFHRVEVQLRRAKERRVDHYRRQAERPPEPVEDEDEYAAEL